MDPVTVTIERDVLYEIKTALSECAEDLDAELRERYPESSLKYPGEKRRFARDRQPVLNARFCLVKLNELLPPEREG